MNQTVKQAVSVAPSVRREARQMSYLPQIVLFSICALTLLIGFN